MGLLDTMSDVGHSNCTRSIAIFLALSAQNAWQGHASSTREICTCPIPDCVSLSRPVSYFSFLVSFSSLWLALFVPVALRDVLATHGLFCYDPFHKLP